jgi:hypothetical protein
MLFVAGNDGSFEPKNCLLTDQEILAIENRFGSYNEMKRELNDSLSVMRSSLSIMRRLSRRTLSKRTNKMSDRKLIYWFESIDMVEDSSKFLIQDVTFLLMHGYYRKVVRKAIKSYLHRYN